MTTLTLYCRGPGEAAWSRLNSILHGSEANEADRVRAKADAHRYITRCREAWAHTALPDHQFIIDTTGRWPAPVVVPALPIAAE